MANPCPTPAHPGPTPDPELVGHSNVANDPSIAPEAGTDTVDEPTVPVAVDGQLSRDSRFRWSAVWGRWVPTGKEEAIDLPGPLEFGPLMPERLHPRGCWCADCWNTGLRYGEYLKAKTVRERNGF